MQETIGFIGLGRMGMPMVRRILATGHKVLASDVVASAVQAAVAMGAVAAGSPAEVAAAAAVTITMLPASPEVEEVVLGPNGFVEGARTGSILIDMSSSSPSSTRRLAQTLEERGITMLDAPVSGGVLGAEAGTLAVMVGGDPAAFERCRPILAAMGHQIQHVGGHGAGHTIKALNNLLSATHLWSACEVLLLGERAGLDPNMMMDVINGSSGRSGSTEVKLPKYVIPHRFESGFGLALMHKDVGLALDMAREYGMPMVLSSLTRELWTSAIARGYGPRDHTAIMELVEEMAGWTKGEGI